MIAGIDMPAGGERVFAPPAGELRAFAANSEPEPRPRSGRTRVAGRLARRQNELAGLRRIDRDAQGPIPFEQKVDRRLAGPQQVRIAQDLADYPAGNPFGECRIVDAALPFLDPQAELVAIARRVLSGERDLADAKGLADDRFPLNTGSRLPGRHGRYDRYQGCCSPRIEGENRRKPA